MPSTRSDAPDRWVFDLWSRFYDLPWVQRLTYRPEQDAVLQRLATHAPRTILDLGCGTGILATRIRAALPASRIVGCDFSRGMLSHAATRGRDVAWVQGNALQLPFPDGAFEAACSTQAFHWFPDPQAALAELHRVLVPRGRLLISIVNPPIAWLSRAARDASRWIGEPLDWPTREHMHRRVSSAGFRVEEQRQILRLPATFVLPTVLTVATRR